MGERTVMQVLNAALRGEVTAEQAADELASPYRRANAIVPRMDGRAVGPSVLARIGAAVLPRFIGARWRWYRRATGGRWALFWERERSSDPWKEYGWLRVPLCSHMEGWPLMFSNGTGHVGACRMDGVCHCEVWP
jgi:hypothetical protein